MIKKTNVSILFYLFIALIFSSCQTRPSVKPHVSGVQIDGEEMGGSPQIDPEARKNEIGPTLEVESEVVAPSPRVRTQVSALVLGPGLYNVAAHVAILNEVEKIEPKPRIISGLGMGAWIAALHAFGQTPQLIEWKLFKFYSEAEDLKPFSTEWKKLLEQKLLSDLKGADIGQAKLILLLPVYDTSERRVRYLKKGSLSEILLANVTTLSETKGQYSTPIEWKYFSRGDLDQVAPDFVLGMDVLDQDVRFERPNDYLMGIFGRIIGWRQNVMDEFDYLLQLPWKGQLDSTKKLSFNMLAARKEIESKREEIQAKINAASESEF